MVPRAQVDYTGVHAPWSKVEMTESQKQMILVLEGAIQVVTRGESPNGLIVILSGYDGPMMSSCTPDVTGTGSLHPMRSLRHKITEILQTYCHSGDAFESTFVDGPA